MTAQVSPGYFSSYCWWQKYCTAYDARNVVFIAVSKPFRAPQAVNDFSINRSSWCFLGIGKSGRLDTSYMILLGGGNSNILFLTPNPGEMIQFDEHIFQSGWFNHRLVHIFILRGFGSFHVVSELPSMMGQWVCQRDGHHPDEFPLQAEPRVFSMMFGYLLVVHIFYLIIWTTVSSFFPCIYKYTEYTIKV